MKKILSLTILALLCNLLLSQTDATAIYNRVDSIKKVGDSYCNAQKYNEAIAMYGEAAELAKKVDNGNNAYYAMAIYNMAYAYSKNGEHQKSVNCYIIAKDVYGGLNGTENIKYAAPLQNSAAKY